MMFSIHTFSLVLPAQVFATGLTLAEALEAQIVQAWQAQHPQRQVQELLRWAVVKASGQPLKLSIEGAVSHGPNV